MEHPFAQFVRIIGKGPKLSRPLTEDEMLEAARMILAGKVEPLQLGAFLAILRLRTEVAEEGSGFVRAVRETLTPPPDAPPVDLDWSSYGGKKRQLPWFLLAALLLAGNGVRVLMQGTEGHTPGRIYSRHALESLGVPIAGSLAEAAEQVRAGNFAYLPLAQLSPILQDIIALKPVLGLRSPVNTFARMINPLAAPHALQTVFHPDYLDVHCSIAALLGQPHLSVFKGEGGEAERRPQKPVRVMSLHRGKLSEETWPPMRNGEKVEVDQDMDLARLGAVWRGDEDDAYATKAVTGTVAIALRLLGRSGGMSEASAEAGRMWDKRNRDRLWMAA